MEARYIRKNTGDSTCSYFNDNGFHTVRAGRCLQYDGWRTDKERAGDFWMVADIVDGRVRGWNGKNRVD